MDLKPEQGAVAGAAARSEDAVDIVVDRDGRGGGGKVAFIGRGGVAFGWA